MVNVMCKKAEKIQGWKKEVNLRNPIEDRFTEQEHKKDVKVPVVKTSTSASRTIVQLAR